MTARHRSIAPAVRIVVVSGLLALAVAAPANAQINHGPLSLAHVEKTTPACKGHPDRHWVGRVAGSIGGVKDASMPVSLVGCFSDRHSCEAWKGRAGGLVTGILTQYSCDPRR